eukprot:7712176-Alexandrium_andersonii.AAC.1
MSASLVGSEMCIRDSLPNKRLRRAPEALVWGVRGGAVAPPRRPRRKAQDTACLLYTSDAADDMQ